MTNSVAMHNLSDVEVGMLALSEAFIPKESSERGAEDSDSEVSDNPYHEIVREIFDIEADRAQKIENLKKSSKRWAYCRNIGTCSSIVSPFLGLFSDSILQILQKDPDPDEQEQYWSAQLGVIVLSGTACIVSVLVSLCFQWTLKKRVDQHQSLLDLSEHDKGTLIKLKAVLGGIGKLKRAQKEEEHDPKIDETLGALFETLKDMPLELGEKELPSKELWASFIINHLPEQHPIKERLVRVAIYERQLAEDSDSSSEDEKRPRSFEDKGQRNARHSQVYEDTDFLPSYKKRIETEWSELRQQMNGLHVPFLYFPRKDNEPLKLENPLGYFGSEPLRKNRKFEEV